MAVVVKILNRAQQLRKNEGRKTVARVFSQVAIFQKTQNKNWSKFVQKKKNFLNRNVAIVSSCRVKNISHKRRKKYICCEVDLTKNLSPEWSPIGPIHISRERKVGRREYLKRTREFFVREICFTTKNGLTTTATTTSVTTTTASVSSVSHHCDLWFWKKVSGVLKKNLKEDKKGSISDTKKTSTIVSFDCLTSWISTEETFKRFLEDLHHLQNSSPGKETASTRQRWSN